MGHREEKKLHDDIDLLGLRAHATAVGLVQLCVELRGAGVLGEAALCRIKDAIATEIALSRPRMVRNRDLDTSFRERLDRLFAGEERLGGRPAELEGRGEAA